MFHIDPYLIYSKSEEIEYMVILESMHSKETNICSNRSIHIYRLEHLYNIFNKRCVGGYGYRFRY